MFPYMNIVSDKYFFGDFNKFETLFSKPFFISFSVHGISKIGKELRKL